MILQVSALSDVELKIEGAKTAKNLCMTKFREWWTNEEIVEVLSNLTTGSDILRQIYNAEHNIRFDPAEVLYDVVGPRFLRGIGNDKETRRTFLLLIIATGVSKGFFTEDDIIDAANEISLKRTVEYMNDVISMRPTQKWCLQLAKVLGLPSSTAEKVDAEEPPSIETVEPHMSINPLYDYQYSTGIYIRKMLEGTKREKGRQVMRKLIAVPTGSGKTRMVTETLIEWLNDGKPSGNEQQRDSRFILWIAQSHELCEQARSTFRDVFKSVGKPGTVMRLYKYWGRDNALPDLEIEDLLDERGIIVASIQSLYSISQSKPEELTRLGDYVSCIIVDEAHHSVAMSYSRVLRKMGFNWDNRKKEISEKGIILLGLTATPFRGSGDTETKRLHRWYNGVHFPAISYVEGSDAVRPHALIDCPTVVFVNDLVRLQGRKSYDLDGYIVKHNWTIYDPKDSEITYTDSPDIEHRFTKPGIHRVVLKVTDNDNDTATAKSEVNAIVKPPKEKIPESQMQKELYGKLIQRRILCDVYHRVIVSQKAIDLTMKDVSEIEMYGEFQPKTLREVGISHERNALILQEILYMKEMGRKKILFFGCTVEHARHIAISLKAMYNINARYVDSAMDMDSRISVINEFRNSDVEVLCNFGVLTTGFDAPGIDCVFVGRPVRSALLYTQMVGRGMRGTKNGGTKDMIIVDIDDNFQINNLRYSPISDKLGWKIYREYWQIWEAPPEEYEIEEVEEADIEHVCQGCNQVAHGPSDIRKVFGFECPDDMLIEFCESGSEALPSLCVKCRS